MPTHHQTARCYTCQSLTQSFKWLSITATHPSSMENKSTIHSYQLTPQVVSMEQNGDGFSRDLEDSQAQTHDPIQCTSREWRESLSNLRG